MKKCSNRIILIKNEWNIEYKREENRNENRKQKIENVIEKIEINNLKGFQKGKEGGGKVKINIFWKG